MIAAERTPEKIDVIPIGPYERRPSCVAPRFAELEQHREQHVRNVELNAHDIRHALPSVYGQRPQAKHAPVPTCRLTDSDRSIGAGRDGVRGLGRTNSDDLGTFEIQGAPPIINDDEGGHLDPAISEHGGDGVPLLSGSRDDRYCALRACCATRAPPPRIRSAGRSPQAGA